MEQSRMSFTSRLRVPLERVGVLIGPDGSVKKKIESMCKVKLEVDSETGEVVMVGRGEAEDPTLFLKCKAIVEAIGRGFSPPVAFNLMNDDFTLEIINLREQVPGSKENLVRVKGRIIGSGGKTRRIIEETTGANISVYGHTVGILGEISEVEIAREAVLMLILGKEHRSVYGYLSRMRERLKREKLKLWEG